MFWQLPVSFLLASANSFSDPVALTAGPEVAVALAVVVEVALAVVLDGDEVVVAGVESVAVGSGEVTEGLGTAAVGMVAGGTRAHPLSATARVKQAGTRR